MPKNPTDYRTALKRGKFEDVEDKDIDYEFVSPNQLFSYSMNIMPLMNAVPSQRAFYGDKFSLQAVAVENGDIPWVQSADTETGKSYDSIVGHKVGSVFSDDDDDTITITDVTPDEIRYTNSKGQPKVKELYNNFTFNRKTGISSIPLVKKGDVIEGKGKRILAKSNYTSNDGSLAMGKNAIFAVVPYKGYSMDDSVVISQDFANKMASTQMYKFGQDLDDGIKIGKEHHHALFPDTFTKSQLDNIDENGVVKVGSVIKKGDPLILSTKPKVVSAKDQQLGRLSKYLKNTRNDASQVWDHENDGIVTDVVKTRHGYRVNVKSTAPMVPGDKMTIRNGQKSYHPDTEVFTDKGWKKIGDLTLEDNVAALFDRNLGKFDPNNGKRIKLPQDLYAKFVHPVVLTQYIYEGTLYGLEANKVAYLVTADHRVWSRANHRHGVDRSRWSCVDACEIHGQNKAFMVKSVFDLSDRSAPDYIQIPFIPYDKASGSLRSNLNLTKFKTEFFVAFMALYLAEGSVAHARSYDSSIRIAQKERAYCRVIEQILSELNLDWAKYNNQYIIRSQKSLCIYLKQFGKSNDKYVPEWIKQLPENLLNIFISAYFQGDGNKCKASKIWSTSEKLINDLAYILTLLGEYPTISKRDIREDYVHPTSGTITHHNYPLFELNVWDKQYATTQKLYKSAYYTLPYNDVVCCCQVPGLGVILTRFHGKVMWNGNCTVSKILPMSEMPRTKVGTDENGEPIYQPVDVLFNPLGIVSRVNAASMMEILLGKVASRTGKHYVIPGFNKADENWYDFVKNEMDKHGITEKEDLYDPTMLDEQGNMKKLDNPVTVGNAYLYKLHHMGESKLSYRGQGIYSSNDQPAKGGESGMKSKRMSGLMTNALLSAGAYNYIKDGMHLRGQRNDDYWRAVRMGETPSLIKKSPFVWNQYLAIMQGAGINALDKGNGILQASPFTDRQFEALNPVEIKNAEIVDMKNLKPVEGGLFDPAMTLTKRWGKITLDRPYPNPGFENAIVSLLGIKKSDMMEIMRGDKALEGYGKGSEALYKALEDIDMDKMLEDAKDQFKNGPKSKKQQAINRIRYIAGLKKNNLTPNELMITKVPVLPSQYRPYSMRGDTFLPGDANELYKDVFLMNEAQKEIRNELGEEEANQNTANVYSSIKALYGFGEPNNQKLKQRGVSGFMNKLVGGTSKFSLLNRSVNSKPNDFTGRGVIDPDVELGMDEVGLPEEMAWTLFGPYISGKLVKGGMSPKAALENIEQKTEAARKALNQVIKERPVTVSRDPQWHKYNTLGGWVKLHNGKNILVNPVINSGAGADFNGDAQIGYIIGLIPNEMLKKGIGSDYLLLTKSNNKHHICSMFKNINIPVYDESKFTMSVMNIADMPHGKLLFEKQGKNGPISFYEGNGMKVLTMNETTSQTVWAEVSCWSYHPQREVEIVNLDQGLQIITDNDPRAVYGLDINSEKYEFGRWTPTEAFEKHVVVPRGHVERDIDESKTLKTIKFGGIDMNTSPEFGYFLGSMMGDGWVTDCIPTQWYISDLQGHVAKKNEKWLKTWIEDLKVTVKVFKKEDHPDRYGDTQRFAFSSIIRGKFISKDLKLFLDGHGDEKTAGSGNKKVPAFMASCPKDCIHAFLAGVFDTDGTIANTQAKVKKSKLLQASITSTSLQLLRDVKFLLGLIGIKSTISFSRTTTRGNEAWLLVCSAIDFYNKGKVIVEHMVDPKKVQAFMDAKQPNADAACVVRLDKIPVLKTLMDLILKTLPSPKLTKALKESHPLKAKIVRELLNIKNNFKDGVKNKSYMVTRFSINTLRRMLVEYENYFNSEKLALLQSNANWHKLCQMADNKNMRWLSIKSVDYTHKKEDGYDLTVPGYDTFMNSDGVVLSNTMTVHVPGTAEAVKDVITKLMPSRQVLSIRDNKNVVNTLKQDFLLPLSLAASAKPSEQTYVFNTKKEALNALKSGRIKYTDDIIVKELEQ